MGLPAVVIATEIAREAVNFFKQPEVMHFLEKNKHMILAGIKVAMPEIKRQNEIKRSEKRAKYHIRGWHAKDNDYHMLTKTYAVANCCLPLF